ncbi:MAG: beta-lactamase family protein [Xanthomonadaceae bacterium]|nr:beta-lactamase family protein [Xanthomonadaceae bacterium]
MFRRWIFVLCLLCAPTFAAPPTSARAPDTPAGRLLSDWLADFDAADRDRLQRFRDAHGIEESVDESLAYRNYSGGLDLVSIDADAPLALKATLRERDAGQADVALTLTLDPERPQRVAVFSVAPQAIVRLSEADALAGLRRRVDALAAEGRFSGTYLIARRGKVLAQGAYGLSNREGKHGRERKMTMDTRLRYASAGKMFTAIAVLQLVDAGKLSLDGSVGDYLPDYPNREVATRVRIRHLLAHTGGVGEIGFWDSPELAAPGAFLAYRDRMRTHADYVAEHAMQPLQFEPGTRMAYSNFGYVLLGHIVEVVSRQPYERYLQRHLFAPAGMRRTGLAPETAHVADRARGYTWRDGRWIDTRDLLPWSGSAAGGGYTTANDLFQFAQALQNGRLLSRERLADATRAQNEAGWYGYGFVVVGQGPLRRYGHSGDFPGTNADVRIFPESGYVLIALSNMDPPAAYRLFRYFEPRMPAE